MDGDEQRPDPPGPITEAYLHRDVHPDQPFDKAVHAAKETSEPLPKAEAVDPDNPEDVWMYT